MSKENEKQTPPLSLEEQLAQANARIKELEEKPNEAPPKTEEPPKSEEPSKTEEPPKSEEPPKTEAPVASAAPAPESNEDLISLVKEQGKSLATLTGEVKRISQGLAKVSTDFHAENTEPNPVPTSGGEAAPGEPQSDPNLKGIDRVEDAFSKDVKALGLS